MADESSTEIQKDILKYINGRMEISNGTTEDPSFYPPTEFLRNTSYDGPVDRNPENKILDAMYDYYPASVLMAGAVCCVLMSIFGTTGNFISILALVKKKRLRNSTTAFVVSLCAADMLFCSFTMPLTAIIFVERTWNYSTALCRFFAMVKFSNTLISIFTVVAITVNRYVLIVHPKIYPKVFTKRKTAIYIFCLWLFPPIFMTLPLFDVWGTLKWNPQNGDCSVNSHNGKSPRAFIFFMILILPSVLFIACYSRIYMVVKRVVRKSHRYAESSGTTNSYTPNESESHVSPACQNVLSHEPEQKVSSFYAFLRDKKEFRVLRIVFVIFVVYVLSVFPVLLIKLFKKEKELPAMTIAGYVFYFLSSVINPVIYIIMSREYRTAYKELFTSKLC